MESAAEYCNLLSQLVYPSSTQPVRQMCVSLGLQFTFRDSTVRRSKPYETSGVTSGAGWVRSRFVHGAKFGGPA